MDYQVNINGIDVVATYSERAVNELFIPLLKHLAKQQDQKGSRLLVMLAAPPGAGKSTLASFFEFLSKEVLPDKKVQAIGMDGFHRRQEYLLSHTTKRDGREICMVKIKGAPETFDLPRLNGKIDELMSEKTCKWPIYDRLLHNPVEDAILVDGDIIILEGNYLLLDEDGWRDLACLADHSITIAAEPELLKKRLIERKIACGNSMDDAVRFVEFSDMANVELCLSKTKQADMQLILQDDGNGCDFHVLKNERF